MNQESEIIIIYDGECEFCKICVIWIKQKLPVMALPFQNTDLTRFGLNQQQCSEQVYAIFGGNTYAGVAAVRFLLHARGNTLLSVIIKSSDGLAGFGYRWVASHRNSLLVTLFAKILAHSNSKHGSL